ncbi:hypothetical protein G9A89_011851 [Geosiphon pyriformis]|nr:hypothetical protein G9A89_011851 [Geosiphon pyriformis]
MAGLEIGITIKLLVRNKNWKSHPRAGFLPISQINTNNSKMSDPYDPHIPRNGAPSGEPGAAKTQVIQQKIDETVGIMRDNINRVAERGERLDVLQDKTENLHQSAQGFRRGANRVRKQMWWKDMKMKIILTIVILILATVIIVPIVVKSKKD